jgi:hypothetical protein
MPTRHIRPRPAAALAGFDVQAFRAFLAAGVEQAGPDDDSVEVALARGILARTCDGCGADLDAAGRADPARLCPACRVARPLVA